PLRLPCPRRVRGGSAVRKTDPARLDARRHRTLHAAAARFWPGSPCPKSLNWCLTVWKRLSAWVSPVFPRCCYSSFRPRHPMPEQVHKKTRILSKITRYDGRRFQAVEPFFEPRVLSAEAPSGRVSVSKTQTVARHLPFLRRYA